MKPCPIIEACAAYLETQADARKSGAGLDVPSAETDFAAIRLRAVAADLRAGLHLPDNQGGQNETHD
ncbi:hypothetical protein [Sphingomonas montanisoli]|uniref:Uncharacterized protein n=1 Tax=Sphingomonas montanisoli TaxID=2606412 RepID=A0A5D9C619_9SPHN|nr:hypothetical protein [Sphingomonas montanisoli]TZG26490.1 hypothetical protein FYJ91_16335 [Sphingomonas montanisoli]